MGNGCRNGRGDRWPFTFAARFRSLDDLEPAHQRDSVTAECINHVPAGLTKTGTWISVETVDAAISAGGDFVDIERPHAVRKLDHLSRAGGAQAPQDRHLLPGIDHQEILDMPVRTSKYIRRKAGYQPFQSISASLILSHKRKRRTYARPEIKGPGVNSGPKAAYGYAATGD
jgi:hypothetical protein